MSQPAGNAVIAQSGGPTVVINSSLAGVVEAIQETELAGSIYGARHAVRGMVAGDFVDLTDLSGAKLELIAGTPGATLGSSRDKPDAGRKIYPSGQGQATEFRNEGEIRARLCHPGSRPVGSVMASSLSDLTALRRGMIRLPSRISSPGIRCCSF